MPAEPEAGPAQGQGRREVSLKEVVAGAEREYILWLLDRHKWNRSRVAGILGVDRRTLFRKIKELGI